MHGIFLLLLLAVMGVTAGAARAAEADDIMALREAGDGRTHVNDFQASWKSAGPNTALAAPAAFRGGGDYLQWKNSCLQTQPAIFGSGYAVEWQRGFSQVVPYTARQASEEAGFIELLAEEFTGG